MNWLSELKTKDTVWIKDNEGVYILSFVLSISTKTGIISVLSPSNNKTRRFRRDGKSHDGSVLLPYEGDMSDFVKNCAILKSLDWSIVSLEKLEKIVAIIND